MQQYILQRLLLIFPTMVGATIIVFLLVRIIPGDVVHLMVAEQGYAGDAEAMRERLGLNEPVYVQYAKWASGLPRLDFGNSLFTSRPVWRELQQRLPVSAELGLLAFLFSLSIAIPVGVASAIRQDSWLDYVLRSTAIGMLSLPGFWAATLIIVFGALWFRWAPPYRFVPFFENPWGNVSQFLLPAFIMGTHMSASVMRMTRTMVLEVLRQDYVRTAWAKGLRERAVIVRHVLKNAFIPVVTILGIQTAYLVGGSVIMEQIFVLPGVGRYLFEAIKVRDYPVIQAINVVLAAVIICMNIVVDLLYGYLDPRIRYQ